MLNFINFFGISFSNVYGSLLEAPPAVSQQAFAQKKASTELGMTWTKKNNSQTEIALGFTDYKGTSHFSIQIKGTFPAELVSEQKYFSHLRSDGISVRAFTYPRYLKSLPFFKPEKMFSSSCSTPGPKMIQTPYLLKIEQLPALLKHKRAIFYTGAGLSAAAVPSMDVLINNLSLERLRDPKQALPYLQDILHHPEVYHQKMIHFFDQCRSALPSKAHFAITHLARQLNWAILTENLDLLHQRAGIDPICLPALSPSLDTFDSLFSTQISQVDFIVVIGLSEDQSQFLQWYKQRHPSGRIIAFNLESPPYLTSTDFLIKGDLQQTIPQFAKLML